MWLLAIAAILNLTLWWLAYQNRVSERIVTTLIASMVGALTTSVAVIVFSRPPSVSEEFVTSLPVSVDNHTLRLVSVLSLDEESHRSVHLFKRANESIAALQTTNASLFLMPYDEFGMTLFHHVLQRAVLEGMAYTFFASWRMERLDTAAGEMSSPKSDPTGDSTIIRAEDFSKYLRGNQFADLQLSLGALHELVLPPRTKVATKPPSEGPASTSTIRLDNPFCRVEIEISSRGAGTGLGSFARFGQPGEWRPAVDIHGPSTMYSFEPVSGRLGLVFYRMSVTASFSALLSGHPEMPAYKTWANELLASLREEWDDQLIMKKAIERIRDEQILGGSPAH
jgi:hypothetical protein